MKVLPLKEAYRFGADHALQDEMATIRDMEIEWDLSYTSSLRRGFVVDLLTKRNLLESFKRECWPDGNSPWGQLTRGRNKALGQLLYYMSWVDKHLGKGPCRGVVVAKEITEDLALAAKRVEGVSLYRYRLSVAVEQVS